MSTRATIRFATREEGVTFNEHPKKWRAQFYKHHDGYPEGLGLDIADSILNNAKLTNWELEHIDVVHGDIEYMYYIWQDHGKDIWISIFEVNGFDGLAPKDECIFVGKPEKLITKYGSQLDESHYKLNTNDDG
jgi:hypothetical protein